MENSVIIGIAGGSGSGKTTITKRITERFPNEVSVIYHDDYYKAHDDMPFEQRKLLNYDHPESFETSLLTEHLRILKNGGEIDCPTYDYSQHNLMHGVTHRIKPNKVIIVEGILILSEEELRDLFDIKIFVDTDADVRILRRLRRDVKERGRSVDSVIEQYLATVKPMHDRFVEPSKRYADVIIPEGGKNEVALNMLLTQIENCIADK